MLDVDSTLRRDLVLANHIIERFHLSNAFGHVSVRIPGTQTFLFPTRRSPGLADEDHLLVLDTDGNILSGEGTPNSEFWIHARIYAERPDVGGVVHAHPPACICLTQIGQPHRIIHNGGGTFHGGIPEFERIGLIRTLACFSPGSESAFGSKAPTTKNRITVCSRWRGGACGGRARGG